MNSKKGKVTITDMYPSESGKVIIVELQQKFTEVVELKGSWLSDAPTEEYERTRYAWSRCTLAEQANGDFKVGDELNGNIIIQERVGQPFYKNQTPKKRPIEGEDKENWPVLTLGGEAIYRQSDYDPTGKVADTLVEHDGESSEVESTPLVKVSEGQDELF